jgi:hypothetical protein
MLEFTVKTNQFPSRRWFSESLKGFETFIIDFSNRIEQVEVTGFEEVDELPNDLEDRGNGVFVFDPKVELTETQKFHNDTDRVWSVIEKLQSFRELLKDKKVVNTFLHIFDATVPRIRHDRQLGNRDGEFDHLNGCFLVNPTVEKINEAIGFEVGNLTSGHTTKGLTFNIFHETEEMNVELIQKFTNKINELSEFVGE